MKKKSECITNTCKQLEQSFDGCANWTHEGCSLEFAPDFIMVKIGLLYRQYKYDEDRMCYWKM